MYDTKLQTIALQVYLTIPILGTVLVSQDSASLTNGISIKVGYGSILGGEIGIKPDGGDVFLIYNFTAFGKQYAGRVKMFSV